MVGLAYIMVNIGTHREMAGVYIVTKRFKTNLIPSVPFYENDVIIKIRITFDCFFALF